MPWVKVYDSVWTGGRVLIRVARGLEIERVEPESAIEVAATDNERSASLDGSVLIVWQTIGAGSPGAIALTPSKKPVLSRVQGLIDHDGQSLQFQARLAWEVAPGRTDPLCFQLTPIGPLTVSRSSRSTNQRRGVSGITR